MPRRSLREATKITALINPPFIRRRATPQQWDNFRVELDYCLPLTITFDLVDVDYVAPLPLTSQCEGACE